MNQLKIILQSKDVAVKLVLPRRDVMVTLNILHFVFHKIRTGDGGSRGVHEQERGRREAATVHASLYGQCGPTVRRYADLVRRQFRRGSVRFQESQKDSRHFGARPTSL